MSKQMQLMAGVVVTVALTLPGVASAQAVPRGSGSSSGSSRSGSSGGSSSGSSGSGSVSSPEPSRPMRTPAPPSARAPRVRSGSSSSSQPAPNEGGTTLSRDSAGRPIAGGAVPRGTVRSPRFYGAGGLYPRVRIRAELV